MLSKFLPVNPHRYHRRTSHDYGLRVIPFGSFCSNLFLPWSDIDLAVVGFRFPFSNLSLSHADEVALLRTPNGSNNSVSGVSSLTPSRRLAKATNEPNGDPPSARSAYPMQSTMTRSSSSNGVMNCNGISSDPRQEILLEMADFFDPATPPLIRDKNTVRAGG